MATNSEFSRYLVDQFREYDGVDIRRMFGGSGLYRDDVMFGLVALHVLYLRTDDRNRGDFEARGIKPFTYRHKNNKGPAEMPYSETSDDVLDDPDILAECAQKAFVAASAAKRKKRKRSAD